jgi:pentapeptide repeat protein
MEQNQQLQSWWKNNWPVLALVALTVVVATIIGLGYWLKWSWTGLEAKLVWDWLELLLIPLVLALAALWFNGQTRKFDQELARRERENDRQISEDRAREEVLQRYLDRMQELILDKGLRRSEKHAEIRDVARARTLAVLRSLDGNRKGQVVKFLHEAYLIGRREGGGRVIRAIIYLHTADLTGAHLNGAKLSGADLSDTFLNGANLENADLGGAHLNGANLSDAEEWTNEQLAQADSLVGATLPDGTKMTQECWEEFKKRYGQWVETTVIPGTELT